MVMVDVDIIAAYRQICNGYVWWQHGIKVGNTVIVTGPMLPWSHWARQQMPPLKFTGASWQQHAVRTQEQSSFSVLMPLVGRQEEHPDCESTNKTIPKVSFRVPAQPEVTLYKMGRLNKKRMCLSVFIGWTPSVSQTTASKHWPDNEYYKTKKVSEQKISTAHRPGCTADPDKA